MLKKVLFNFEEIIAALFLSVMILVLVVNVTIRITTSHSLLWVEEITYFCFAWVVFIGAAAAYKRNMHSSIDMVIKHFPEKARTAVALVGMILTTIVCIVMIVLSFNFAIKAWSKYTPALYIRYTFIDISVTVGFTFTLIHCLGFIKNMIKYRDYIKEIPLYKNMISIDAIMGGGVEDTVLHTVTAEDNKGVK
jgi:TRAP-type C4-dicarboxylate transport system permease small subunit